MWILNDALSVKELWHQSHWRIFFLVFILRCACFMCFFKLDSALNDQPHVLHRNIALECSLTLCLFKLFFVVYFFWQMSQLKVSPLCSRKWSYKFRFRRKCFLHSVQVYGLSPKWTFRWVSINRSCVKRLLHKSHLYIFLSWVSSCARKLLFLVNRLSHRLHWNKFSPVWIFWCSLSEFLVLYVLGHSLHLKTFSLSCFESTTSVWDRTNCLSCQLSCPAASSTKRGVLLLTLRWTVDSECLGCFGSMISLSDGTNCLSCQLSCSVPSFAKLRGALLPSVRWAVDSEFCEDVWSNSMKQVYKTNL